MSKHTYLRDVCLMVIPPPFPASLLIVYCKKELPFPIYLFDHLYQYGLMDIHFILWLKYNDIVIFLLRCFQFWPLELSLSLNDLEHVNGCYHFYPSLANKQPVTLQANGFIQEQ